MDHAHLHTTQEHLRSRGRVSFHGTYTTVSPFFAPVPSLSCLIPL